MKIYVSSNRADIQSQATLDEGEKSKVVKYYRRYNSRTGKWYESLTPQKGYNLISYKATHKRNALFHSDYASAAKEAEQYNKRKYAYKKGRIAKQIAESLTEFPDTISWEDDMPEELKDDTKWWHTKDAWMYEHQGIGNTDWAEWDLEALLQEHDVDTPYADYGHTTIDFFNVLFLDSRFSHGYNLELRPIGKEEYLTSVKDNGDWVVDENGIPVVERRKATMYAIFAV